MRGTVSAAATRRSERWCRAGSRFAGHLAQFVPGQGGAKRGGRDRGPTLIETHSWCGSNGFQASQDDSSIGLLRDTECLPGAGSSEHNPSFRIDYAHPHGGNVPLLAASVNQRHRRFPERWVATSSVAARGSDAPWNGTRCDATARGANAAGCGTPCRAGTEWGSATASSGGGGSAPPGRRWRSAEPRNRGHGAAAAGCGVARGRGAEPSEAATGTSEPADWRSSHAPGERAVPSPTEGLR